MRLIDADALMKWLNDTYCDISKRLWNYNHHVMAMDMIEIIENYPIVEERKHGHWGKDDYKCSVCGVKRPTTDTASKWIYLDQRYCYNCGAAMDEEEKADE